jgi:hypothetical protein
MRRRLKLEDVPRVVALIARRAEGRLERRGLAAAPKALGAPDLWSEEAPVLAAVMAGIRAGAAAVSADGARLSWRLLTGERAARAAQRRTA